MRVKDLLNCWRLKFSVEQTMSLRHIRWDLQHLRQVFMNLHRDYTIQGISRKFGQRRVGRFRVRRVANPLAYESGLPEHPRIHLVVSAVREYTSTW